jgi:phosphatidylserine/phosphatidylglycerophosphate/cardiolipin synthase-like enzyme
VEALRAAQRRGVEVRILIDPRQHHAHDQLETLTRVTHESTRNPWMHLKSYAIDGAVLRTGSANFSGFGEKQQDNDLVVREAWVAQQFEARFATIWAAGRPHTGHADAKHGEPANRGHEPECDNKGNVSRAEVELMVQALHALMEQRESEGSR